MARKLEVEIVGDASSLRSALGSAGKQTDSFGSKLGGLGKAAAFGAGAAGVAGLAFAIKDVAGDMIAGQKATSQTNAVLKSTGGVSGVTTKRVQDLASAIQAKSGMDDAAIQSGENMLLTFTNIRNETGKGAKVFDQATSILADMSAAFGTDASKSAIQLGKALNDPIKGVGALSKIGVTFTEGQKTQIAAFMKAGETAKAQGVILGELKKEVGGSAEAMGKTLPGQINILRGHLEDLGGELALKLQPKLQLAIAWLKDHWPEIQAAFAQFWATVKPILSAFGSLVVSVVGLIRQHWGTIGPILANVGNAIKSFAAVVAGVVKLVADLLHGDWSAAWKDLKGIAQNALNAVSSILRAQLGIWKAEALALAKGIALGIQAGLAGLGALVEAGLAAVRHAIRATAGAAYGWAKEIALQIGFGIIDGIRGMAGAIKDAVIGVAKGALGSVKGYLHIGSPSKLFADQVGKPIGEGIAAGIVNSGPLVQKALQSMLFQAVRARNFSNVSSIVNSIFAAKQGDVKTPAEKQIAQIERSRNIGDLKQSIADAKTAVANSAQALAEAQATGDAVAIAQAQQQLASDKRAEARAEQDLKLFYLQETAAKQRAALDAQQMAQQIKLGLQLDHLNVLFEKHGVTIAQLMRAVRRILHNLHVPGFASGVRNFAGGLAIVGERGPELVSLPSGSDVIPFGGGGGSVVHVHYHGTVIQERDAAKTIATMLNRERARGNPMLLGTG